MMLMINIQIHIIIIVVALSFLLLHHICATCWSQTNQQYSQHKRQKTITFFWMLIRKHKVINVYRIAKQININISDPCKTTKVTSNPGSYYSDVVFYIAVNQEMQIFFHNSYISKSGFLTYVNLINYNEIINTQC